jgi:hypothetical protein
VALIFFLLGELARIILLLGNLASKVGPSCIRMDVFFGEVYQMVEIFMATKP